MNQMTQKEMDGLSALVMLHAQKVSDYTRAVPNAGMARKHNEWVELLRKAQTLLRGEPLTCERCVREGNQFVNSGCVKCPRNPDMVDNFKRRAT